MLEYKQVVMQSLPGEINLTLRLYWTEVNHMAINKKRVPSDGNIWAKILKCWSKHQKEAIVAWKL